MPHFDPKGKVCMTFVMTVNRGWIPYLQEALLTLCGFALRLTALAQDFGSLKRGGDAPFDFAQDWKYFGSRNAEIIVCGILPFYNG